MGELLFWVGEDKMTFGSDYAIWEPKWQVEGFVDWEMPDDDEFPTTRGLTADAKKKILGLNAAKLYDIEVPADRRRLPTPARRPGGREAAQARRPRTARGEMVTAVRRRRDAGRGRRWRRCATPSSTSRSPRSASWPRAPCRGRRASEVRLRLPTYFCAPNFAFLMVADAYDAVSAGCRGRRAPGSCWKTTSPGTRSTAGVAAGAGFVRRSTARPSASSTGCGADFLRKAVLAGTDQVARPCARQRQAVGDAAAWPGCGLGDAARPALGRAPRQRRAELGLPAGDDAPLLMDPVTGRPSSTSRRAVPLHLRGPGRYPGQAR